VELSFRRRFQLRPEIEIDARLTAADRTGIDQASLLIIGAALVAFVFKLAIAYNTFGATDAAVVEWTLKAGIVRSCPRDRLATPSSLPARSSQLLCLRLVRFFYLSAGSVPAIHGLASAICSLVFPSVLGMANPE
jgi:hypothetical protein